MCNTAYNLKAVFKLMLPCVQPVTAKGRPKCIINKRRKNLGGSFSPQPSLPTPLVYNQLCLLLSSYAVLGAIAVTLQPLWPDSTRVGVWYLSMGLFIIVGLLLVVIVGKLSSQCVQIFSLPNA